MKIAQTIAGLWLATATFTMAAAPQAVTHGDTADSIGAITLGAHGSDTQARGMADAVIPLWYSEGGVVFLNPRVSFNDASEEEFNIGFAWRALVADAQLIVGANTFYDSRWSAHNNRFEQVGAGFELLSSWIDARFNYYYPDDDKKITETFQTTETTSSSRTVTGPPYLSGTTILQDRTSITDTTTTTRWFEDYEVALEGYDAEIGARLPFLEEHATTRIFIGYQSFDNPFGPDREGLKGRIEVRFGEGLLLDGEVYENEDLNQTDFFAGVRIRLPFSIGNLVHGKNPFEGAKAAFQPQTPELASRLGEMVIRDMNIRLGDSGTTENTNKGTTSNTETLGTDTTVIGKTPPPPPIEEPE